MNNKKKTSGKLTAAIVTLTLIVLCLALTSFALVKETVAIEGNIFKTGDISINLNDGKPVINENEFKFEPGMTVIKDFFIENEGSWAVYYKLYFEQVDGDLADILKISIKDGEETICEGTARQLQGMDTTPARDILNVGERRNLTIYFYYPEQEGNRGQGKELTFSISAKAVQTKNNPDREFD